MDDLTEIFPQQETLSVIETHARMAAPVVTWEMLSPVTVPRNLKAVHANSVSHFKFFIHLLGDKFNLNYKKEIFTFGFSCSSAVASIKACDSSPCHHGGTCVNSGDSFTCICKDGYEGPLCEADINNCNPFPW